MNRNETHLISISEKQTEENAIFTCNRPSKDLGIVIQFEFSLCDESARSKSSITPFRFFNFFTKLSTAFSAHLSSSSPCFHPNSFFTAGLFIAKKFCIDDSFEVDGFSSKSVNILLYCCCCCCCNVISLG